jgi:hypothetical protein
MKRYETTPQRYQETAFCFALALAVGLIALVAKGCQ